MPKYKIACLLLAAVLAAVGTVLVIRNLGSEDIPEFVKPTEDPNTYLDRTDDMDINDSNADVRQYLFVAHKLLLSGKGFYGLSEGTSSAMGVKQNVRNTRYVVGEFDRKHVFKEMVTKGIVSKAYQLYMQDNNYVYRKGMKVNAIDDVDWANSAQALSEAGFYNDFGHRNDKLTGYILNWDTVTSGELVSTDNGVYTFRYVLDTEAAPAYLRREMIFNGNLNSEPSFSKCVIYVAMDADFNVKTLRTDCEYKAQTMGINATCSEDITEVFTPYEGELPEKSFFEQYFTENPDDGIDDEQTALDVLMAMFSPYLGGETLQVAIDASANGESIVNGLVSIDGLDISDLSKLTVNASLGNLDIAYVHGDETIYLKYKDFQASTTVNGILGALAEFAPLFGGEMTGLALDDFDVESLLSDLTYAIDGDKVVVSLPVALGDLTIDAKLCGDVDGESYTFSHAVIGIGKVEISIAPRAWTVAERTGEYPEILGLVDLIQNGKLALNANLTLSNYAVGADVLVDLATGNLEINAQLGNNGAVNVIFADGVAYVAFGEVKLKLDTTNIQGLLDAIYKYTGIKLASATPSIDISAQTILELLGGITTTKVENGVDFNMSVLGIDVALHLANNEGSWQIDSITAVTEGINLQVAPGDALGEVSAPADVESYADITELVETFAEPIANAINGVYGASFNATLSLDGKQYDIQGSVRVDLNKTLKINATVYDGNLGIIDAEVIYANNTVFLTLNGVKVAFAVDGSSSDVDIVAKLSELLNNAQIKGILDCRKELAELVEQAKTLVGVVTNFTLSDLLDVDFTQVITAFSFNNGELCVSLDGSALGLNGLALDIAVANNDGSLALKVGGLKFASLGLDIGAVLINSAEEIAIPDTSEYMLTLAGELLGAELQVTVDVVHMDVWASVAFGNEKILVRYLDNNVYVQYGGASVVVNTAELGSIVTKLDKLAGGLPEMGSIDIMQVLAVLGAIRADLTGETPNLSLDISGVNASVNFVNVNNKLVFDNISVRFALGGKQQVATVSQQTMPAEQLDVTGEFVDGNALIESLLDTVDAFMNNNGIEAVLSFELNINGVQYMADVTVKYNDGLYVNAILKNDGKVAISAEIYLVDGTLYFDVNGIRQAIELPDMNGELDFAEIVGALAQIDGIGDKLDSMMQYVENIPEYLKEIVFSDIINKLTFSDGVIALNLDLAQFGLTNVNVTVGLGSTLTLDVNGQISDVACNATATLVNHCDTVVAPELYTYVTELKVTVSEDIYATIKLDLYHGTIVGKAVVYGQTVNFKYVDGTVYATYGSQSNFGFKLKLEDINILLDEISRFVELPQTDFDSNENVIEDVLEKIKEIEFARYYTDNGYVLEVNYNNIIVAVSFVQDANKVSLHKVEIGVGELNVTAEQVYGNSYTDLPVNGNYVDLVQLVSNLAPSVENLVNANGYIIDVDANIKLSGRVYGIKATVKLNTNVYVQFALSYQGALMLEGELWMVDNVLYLDAGDLRLAVPLEEKTDDGNEMTLESIKQTLENVKGYNGYVDEIVELVLNVLNTPVNEIDFERLLESLTYDNGILKLGVNGEQFNLNSFALGLGNTDDGLNVFVNKLQYGDIILNVNNASVIAYDGEITVPNEDFSTNIKVVIDESNSLYANIDLFKNVIKMKLVSRTSSGKPATLDLMYSINDNILKITDGKDLYVSVDITSIANIVKEINRVVNEFAGADVELPLPGLGEMNNINLKDIVRSLGISNNGNTVSVALTALGLNITANFNSGALNNVTIPLMEDVTLKVEPTNTTVNFRDFPEDEEGYVRIDQVFNDYYFGGDGTISNDNGPIYDLINTNSWKFDFVKDSIITVTNDDGTTTKYQIAAKSFFVFYYNKTEVENTKLRAKLTINKMEHGSDKWGEFIILDVAYIDGRIYISYDSNSNDSKGNVLRATVSMKSLKETIALKDELIRVLQLENLIQQITDSIANAKGNISLGNLASMFKSVGYNDNIFTLDLNSGIIENLGEISLSVKGEGSTLTLNQLTLDYNNISVNLEGIRVSASAKNDKGEFDFVTKDIMGYYSANAATSKDKGKGSATEDYDPTNDHGKDMSNHMNFDSLYELVSALLRTAGATDEAGRRTFYVDGTVEVNVTLVLNILGKEVEIPIKNLPIGLTMYADIDEFGNSYFAVKIVRTDATVLGGHVYNDLGGNGYIVFSSKTGLFNIARDSIVERTKTDTWIEDESYYYCTKCEEEKSLNYCGSWTGLEMHRGKYMETRTRPVTKSKSYKVTDYETVLNENGKPEYYRENLTAKDLFANIGTTEGECPFFELLNLGTVVGVNLGNTIREQIGKPNSNVYGVEDVLTGYGYSDSQFKITADLSAISSALGTLTLTIGHDDTYYLTTLNGDLDIANLVFINLALNHSTPSKYGTAQQFVEDYTRTWQQPWNIKDRGLA